MGGEADGEGKRDSGVGAGVSHEWLAGWGLG